MRNIKVLLADDHALLRSGLSSLLNEENGIEVVGEAEDGRDAVRKVQELDPDVVLMDIGMPVMNGIDATKQITKRNRDVKVLVLTVYDNEEYLTQAFESGAAGYILKQAADSDLLNAIHVIARGEYFLYPSVTKTVVDNFLEKMKMQQSPATAQNILTDREVEVLRLLAEGYNCREVAESLIISVKTVETHKSNIMAKLDLHKRPELVRYAIQNGILQLDLDEVMQ